jgi:hypothetical protein
MTSSRDPEKEVPIIFAGGESSSTEDMPSAITGSENIDIEDGNSVHKLGSAKEQAQASRAPVKPTFDPSLFPDGGRQAWLVVLGALCSLFVSFGEPDHGTIFKILADLSQAG